MIRVLLLLVLLLSACVGQSPTPLPLPSTVQREETLALPALLSEPQRWSGQRITLIAPVLLRDDERILTMQLGQPNPASESALWLAEAPSDAVRRQLDDGAGFLKLRGRLSPPGAFGRDQHYAYQFVADDIGVIEPERTTIAIMADNPLAIDGVLLAITGTLLLRGDSALLVDRVSAGGVPEAEARQIKLPRSAVAENITTAFKRSGGVRWGPVRITGWWQNAAIAPFAVEPQLD